MRAELVSGAGNLFVLLDAREGGAPTPAEARGWCERAAEFGGRGADGLLVLMAGAGSTRLVVFNSDGSLAAACGNGLRCAGWFMLRETGGAEALFETESGQRVVRGEIQEGGAESLAADLGVVRVERLGDELSLEGPETSAWRGDVGNPHCVFLVDDIASPGFRARGASLQEHEAFPDGVNVGYLAQEAGAWKLRVFERGVGETEACGTGAAAAAFVLEEAHRISFPIELELPGGRLEITTDGEGWAHVIGPVEHLGALHLEPVTGSSG